MEWSETSWVVRGRLRKRVLKALDKPKTATILSKELKTHRSTISSILNHMDDREIAVCLDPKQPYNRYYKRTKKGEDLLEEITHLG